MDNKLILDSSVAARAKERKKRQYYFRFRTKSPLYNESLKIMANTAENIFPDLRTDSAQFMDSVYFHKCFPYLRSPVLLRLLFPTMLSNAEVSKSFPKPSFYAIYWDSFFQPFQINGQK